MEDPRVSTVILNWNRVHLLRVTVESYLDTVSVPYQLIIVDNASTDSSREYIESVCAKSPRHRAVLRKRNVGGPALNSGLRLARAPFLHTSENDLEYMSGWDTDLLDKFEVFPELGQLSVFGPEPESERGEIWEAHPAETLIRNGRTIHLAESVGTSSVWRREIWDRGFRWGSVPTFQGRRVKLPNDFAASSQVRELGYQVAWNDRYTVINWGHNVEEWKAHLDYYLENVQAKPWIGVDGLRDRLKAHGYNLIQVDGKSSIVKL